MCWLIVRNVFTENIDPAPNVINEKVLASFLFRSYLWLLVLCFSTAHHTTRESLFFCCQMTPWL